MAFDPSKFGKWSHKALQMDTATLDRARKVLALHVRGATEGEKAAAGNRLASIAATAGTDLRILIKALS